MAVKSDIVPLQRDVREAGRNKDGNKSKNKNKRRKSKTKLNKKKKNALKKKNNNKRKGKVTRKKNKKGSNESALKRLKKEKKRNKKLIKRKPERKSKQKKESKRNPIIKKTKKVSKQKKNLGKENRNTNTKAKYKKLAKENRQSSSDCEATMCSMAKKFNLYQTQYRKANRIESWVDLTANKRTKAATTFTNASTAIRESTKNGTECDGGSINEEEKTANSRLLTCNTTAAALCNSSAEVNTTSKDLITSCKPLLKTFIDGYKVK